MNLIERWKIFFKERFPILPNVLITAGLISSSFALNKTPMNAFTYAFSAVVFFLFLAQLRFMDELKDYQKDLIAHPERPLPRGIIKTEEMRKLIYLVQCLLFALAILAFKIFSSFVGSCLLFGIFWLFLMYNEFFVGKSLSKYPFIYAITHQVIIIPMGLFALSAINQINHFDLPILLMSALLLCTFFMYEISRKLDPNALPILGTYLIMSGRTKTVLAISLLAVLTFVIASLLQLGPWVYLPLIVVYFSHAIIYLAPHKFKITEAVVTFYLLYIIWMLPIKNLF